MILEHATPNIAPMARFTLHCLHAGTHKPTGAKFAIHARNDGRVPYVVSAAPDGDAWTEAGSCRNVTEAQRAIEAAIAFRGQASAA